MPLETRTISIDDEIERLDEKRRKTAAEQAEADYESDAAKQLASEGQEANRHLAGLHWFRQEYPECETITLSALTNGERHRVRSLVQDVDVQGIRQNAYVAAGTYDAPYLEHEPDDVEDNQFEQTVARIADVHPSFADWAESKIKDVSSMSDVMGKSYRELVLEKRKQQTSSETSG